MNDTEIILSTLTIECKFSNVKFNIKNIIDIFKLDKNIIKIGCNYGELISDEYKQIIENNSSNVKLGRKKDAKIKRYFNSQITFILLSDFKKNNNEKKYYYNVKLFSNGRIQIPGVITEEISNIVPDIKILLEYFNKFESIKINKNEKILISNCYTKSYNFLFKYFRKNKELEDEINLIIHNDKYNSVSFDYKNIFNEEIINKLENIKNSENCDIELDINNFLKINNITEEELNNNFENHIKVIMKNYKFQLLFNLKKIIDLKKLKLYFDSIIDNNEFKYKLKFIMFNPEKCVNLKLKFLTPNILLDKMDKLTTISIYGSGKINISCNDRDDCNYFKNLLMNIIENNFDNFVYNLNY